MVISAIVLLIFGYNFLKGNNLLSNDRTFYAMYDNVEGLTTASLVTVNGLKVGLVRNIDFADAKGKLKVTFVVDSDFQFGKNSVAKIYSAGFISGKSLAIIPESTPTEMAISGQQLKSEVEVGLMDSVTSSLDPLQDKLNAVLTKSEILISSLNKVLNEENTQNISASLKDLSGSLNSLKYTAGSMQSLMAKNEVNITKTLSNFTDASTNAKVFSDKLSDVKIENMMGELETTIKSFSAISEKLNSSSGTAGKLLNDDKVYDNLDRATRQLDLLLQDVKLHPKRYVHFSVFGKKDGEYEKPNDPLK